MLHRNVEELLKTTSYAELVKWAAFINRERQREQLAMEAGR